MIIEIITTNIPSPGIYKLRSLFCAVNITEKIEKLPTKDETVKTTLNASNMKTPNLN